VRFQDGPAVAIPRRWAWTLGIGVAMLAGLLVWLLFAGRAVAPPENAAVRGTGAALGQERQMMGPVPLRASAVSTAAPSSTEPARGVDEYEVCGGTWVKANADGNLDDAILKGPMRRDEAVQAVARALAADARPVARAAGLILQAMEGGEDHRRAVMIGTIACAPDCPQASGIPAAAFDAVAAARESLARLAVTTTDPAAYALAFRMCGRLRAGSCALLSPEQWARLDPGNAAPWQEAFATAQARKDIPAANEALHRIATSQRSDQRFFDLPGLFVDAVPDDDGLRNGVFMLAVDAIGFQSAWVMPSYQPLASACRRDALRDSNRRQTCEAIAELMAEKSDTLIERSMAVAVGRQLGWPDARLERMRAEQLAFGQSVFDGVDARNAMSCETIKRVTDDVRRKARLGEVGAMREWLAHDAPPLDELLRRARTELREQAERSQAYAAAQAASAASAPG